MASIVVALLVMGSWFLPEGTFDSGPYAYQSKHETVAECKIAKHGDDGICVDHKSGGAMLFVKVDE